MSPLDQHTTHFAAREGDVDCQPLGAPADHARLPCILLVSEDCELTAWMKYVLQRIGYDVQYCSGDDLGDLLVDPASGCWKLSLSICDRRSLDETTIEIIHQLQERGRFPPTVVIGPRTSAARFGTGAALLENPYDAAALLSAVRELAPHT